MGEVEGLFIRAKKNSKNATSPKAHLSMSDSSWREGPSESGQFQGLSKLLSLLPEFKKLLC